MVLLCDATCAVGVCDDRASYVIDRKSKEKGGTRHGGREYPRTEIANMEAERPGPVNVSLPLGGRWSPLMRQKWSWSEDSTETATSSSSA